MEKPHIRVVAAEVERDGKFLISQRQAHARMPLLWEFPGGRVEPGETDEVALARELKEKISLEAEVGVLSLHITHVYDEYTLDFLVYRVKACSEPLARSVADVRWVAPEDFDQYRFPGADQRSVDALLSDTPDD